MDGNRDKGYWGSRGDSSGGTGESRSRGGGKDGPSRPEALPFDASRGMGGPPAPSGKSFASRGSAVATARRDGRAIQGEISLAEWRDGMMATGDIPPKTVFAVCLEIARKADLAEKMGVFPELDPDSIRVAVGKAGDAPKVVDLGGPNGDGAGRQPRAGRPGKARTADATRHSLASILYELFEGRRPTADGNGRAAPIGVGILSAAQNRVLARAFADNPSKRFATCAALVLAVRDGKDGRGWRPFAAAALALAIGAAGVLAYREVERRFKAATDEIVQQVPQAGGGVVSSLDLLKERAEAGDSEALLELGLKYASGEDLAKDDEAALDCFLKGAEAGNTRAMVLAGKMLAAREDVANGGELAASWFEKAAKGGDNEGRSLWAQCLWQGRGVAQDRKEAARWAFLAADAEIPEAEFIAGTCLLDGIGAPQDVPGGVRLVNRAADKGLPEAQLGMARFHASGTGVAKNGRLAVQWAGKAAEGGLPEAQALLGGLLYAGAGGAPDKSGALKWYLEAAGKGSADAQAHAGAMFVAGDGVEKDLARGVALLRQAADQDFPMAFSALAKCHSEGWGVPKDERKAAALLKRGAELGDPSAMGEYGAALVLGNMVAKNPAEGLRWMERAAEAGDPVQQLALARILLNGLAGGVDGAKGMKWLEKAAEAGLPEAQSQLAILLQKGKGADSNPNRSFDLHLAAARAGNVVSQSQIATYYYNGYGCDRDYEEACRWYKTAAEGGNEDAMVGLANCYDKGHGTPTDKNEALRWYKKAAGAANPNIAAVAKRAVARLAADGFGDASDAAEAIHIYRERAEAGDVLAMYDLAQRLDEGKGVPKDPVEAVKWWRRIAEIPQLRKDVGTLQIGAWAQYGIHLLDGVGVTRNSREAVRWLEMAAGDTDAKTEMGLGDANLKLKALACRRLAECHDKGDGVPRDPQKALAWYRTGALNGDAESSLETGDRYADGRAGAPDPIGYQRWYERAANNGSAEGAYRAGLAYAAQGAFWKNKARQWLEKADAMGHPKAKKALADLESGALFQSGRRKGASPGTRPAGSISAAEAHNKGVAAAARGAGAEAAKWYRQAADQGFAPSCYNLATLLYKGQGVRQDYAEAARLFRKAADTGMAEAQHSLGICYLNGRGVPKNATEAVKWFRKSATKGYALAQHSLGACLVNGDGVRKDYNEAIQWFRKAAAQGNEASRDALRQLGVR